MSVNVKMELIQEVITRWMDVNSLLKDETVEDFHYLEEINEILDEEMPSVCIPEGYKQIAVRNDRYGLNIVFYHPDTHMYLTVINGKQAGPYSLDDIKQLKENYKDVVDLHGRYMYIEEEFDVTARSA